MNTKSDVEISLCSILGLLSATSTKAWIVASKPEQLTNVERVVSMMIWGGKVVNKETRGGVIV